MRSWGCAPVVFGPGTLWRTWGTRPVPYDLAWHRLRRDGLAWRRTYEYVPAEIPNSVQFCSSNRETTVYPWDALAVQI